MKIVMFGHKRVPGREGGVEVVVENLSTQMVRLGHSVTLLNRTGKHIAGNSFNSNKIKEFKGVTLKSLPTIDKKGLAAVTSSFLGGIISAFSNADVVHIHAEGPAVMCWLPKIAGKKVIVTIHGLDWRRKKWGTGLASKYILLGEKLAVKFADEIIVLSKNIQNYFYNTYNRKTIFIPNGVERPHIKAASEIKEKFNLEKDSYILFLGRIVPEKGIHYLVEAFLNAKTDKKLVIAGESSDSQEYANYIRQLAKDCDRIIFTGFVHGELLKELYSNSYIYVLPSDLEGMPLSLLEAMSYGNCCLVSDIPECTEVVENNAVVFNNGNIGSLQNELQRLCDNKDIIEYYRKNSADYICRKYNWDIVIQQTIDVYLGNKTANESFNGK